MATDSGTRILGCPHERRARPIRPKNHRMPRHARDASLARRPGPARIAADCSPDLMRHCAHVLPTRPPGRPRPITPGEMPEPCTGCSTQVHAGRHWPSFGRGVTGSGQRAGQHPSGPETMMSPARESRRSTHRRSGRREAECICRSLASRARYHAAKHGAT